VAPLGEANRDRKMRNLIYIPIVHTEVDMGSMSTSLRKEYLTRYGKEKWRQHTKAIDSMWDGLCRKIFDLNLPYGKLRIYQDGLPVCGRELEIIREAAEKGSRNHKIVLDLVEKGARLEGTESPDLLLQEYNNFKKLQGTSNIKMSDDLLIKRDKFIANRIESTLTEDEIGILFMGLMHRVDKYLSGIKVSYLIHRLPFKESYEEK